MERGTIASIFRDVAVAKPALIFGITVAIGVLEPTLVSAQVRGWEGSIDASGSVLFGNASDHLISAQLQVARADSTVEVRTDARFTYAASRVGSDERRVTGRTALMSLAVDYHPLGRYSPFWFGSVESSLQQQIARRLATGAGAKLTFHRRDTDEASLSLALLGEQTRALTSTVALTATFHDTYDSEARSRGAVSNNDGQMLFGVRAEF